MDIDILILDSFPLPEKLVAENLIFDINDNEYSLQKLIVNKEIIHLKNINNPLIIKIFTSDKNLFGHSTFDIKRIKELFSFDNKSYIFWLEFKKNFNELTDNYLFLFYDYIRLKTKIIISNKINTSAKLPINNFDKINNINNSLTNINQSKYKNIKKQLNINLGSLNANLTNSKVFCESNRNKHGGFDKNIDIENENNELYSTTGNIPFHSESKESGSSKNNANTKENQYSSIKQIKKLSVSNNEINKNKGKSPSAKIKLNKIYPIKNEYKNKGTNNGDYLLSSNDFFPNNSYYKTQMRKNDSRNKINNKKKNLKSTNKNRKDLKENDFKNEIKNLEMNNKSNISFINGNKNNKEEQGSNSNLTGNETNTNKNSLAFSINLSGSKKSALVSKKYKSNSSNKLRPEKLKQNNKNKTNDNLYLQDDNILNFLDKKITSKDSNNNNNNKVGIYTPLNSEKEKEFIKTNDELSEENFKIDNKSINLNDLIVLQNNNVKNNDINSYNLENNFLLVNKKQLNSDKNFNNSSSLFFNCNSEENLSQSNKEDIEDSKNPVTYEEYNSLKKDFELLYTNSFIKSIQNDLIDLEFKLAFEKSLALFTSYNNEVEFLYLKNRTLNNIIESITHQIKCLNKKINKLNSKKLDFEIKQQKLKLIKEGDFHFKEDIKTQKLIQKQILESMFGSSPEDKRQILQEIFKNLFKNKPLLFKVFNNRGDLDKQIKTSSNREKERLPSNKYDKDNNYNEIKDGKNKNILGKKSIHRSGTSGFPNIVRENEMISVRTPKNKNNNFFKMKPFPITNKNYDKTCNRSNSKNFLLSNKKSPRVMSNFTNICEPNNLFSNSEMVKKNTNSKSTSKFQKSNTKKSFYEKKNGKSQVQ